MQCSAAAAAAAACNIWVSGYCHVIWRLDLKLIKTNGKLMMAANGQIKLNLDESMD